MRIHFTRSMQLAIAFTALGMIRGAAANDAVLPPLSERFAAAEVREEPSFQRHVSPLLGRLGCNGRACHGSFQGQGGFRLSLFGYDFQADHDALLDKEHPRVNIANPKASLILNKPTDADNHEGGLRYETGSWQYYVFRRWIESGAKFDKADLQQLVKLDVSPREILFSKTGQQTQLKAVAVWEDGTREDVTPLCRFQSNSDQVALINENGLVSAAEPGDTHVVVFYDNAVVPIPVIRPVSELTGPNYPKVPTPTKVDALVVQKLNKLGIVPSGLCTDAEFLRRVSLDMTGTLPTAQEVEAFVADSTPNKRSEKIEQLLDSPAYAAWWTTKLCDYTGNNDAQLRNAVPQVDRNYSSASQQWYDWIYKRVEENVPYDQLVAGIATATSRPKGQSYTEYCEEMSAIYRGDSQTTFADLPSMPHYWARQDLREPEPRAISFAYAFMGLRIQCAQCHKHPFDQWSKEDFEQFTNFFRPVVFSNNGPRREDRAEFDALVKKLGVANEKGNDLRKELGLQLKQGKTVPFPEVYVNTAAPAPKRNIGKGKKAPARSVPEAKLLGGDVVSSADYSDLREPLMEWLRDNNNPYFARAFVNRVWASYFNRGIVEPPDDLSLANPPSNKPLLDYLAQGFIQSGFDMKWVHREIANSRTYQLSWQPNETNRGDEVNFSHAIPRRLPAEAAYDAVVQATASDAEAAVLHDELNGRAIAIAGSSARNQGRGNGSSYALTIFGKSIRESNCDCDRSSEASLLQTVYLQNDRDVLTMIDRRKEGWIDQISLQLTPKKGSAVRMSDTEQLVRQAYLRTLSRYPDASELERSVQYVAAADDTISGLRGVLWALLNTKEFIVNH